MRLTHQVALLALCGGFLGGVAYAYLSGPKVTVTVADDGPSYAQCETMVPPTLGKSEWNDWMRYCVDGGEAPDKSGSAEREGDRPPTAKRAHREFKPE